MLECPSRRCSAMGWMPSLMSRLAWGVAQVVDPGALREHPGAFLRVARDWLDQFRVRPRRLPRGRFGDQLLAGVTFAH